MQSTNVDSAKSEFINSNDQQQKLHDRCCLLSPLIRCLPLIRRLPDAGGIAQLVER